MGCGMAHCASSASARNVAGQRRARGAGGDRRTSSAGLLSWRGGQLTIPGGSGEFMQACRKDTLGPEGIELGQGCPQVLLVDDLVLQAQQLGPCRLGFLLEP